MNSTPRPSFKVQQGIPIPEAPRSFRYPLTYMQVGDSFLIPVGSKDFHNVYACAKRRGMKVTVRAVKGGFRAWRVK